MSALRPRDRVRVPYRDKAVVVPSAGASAAIVGMSFGTDTWHWACTSSFLVGAIVAFVAIESLGPSFGFFPRVRPVVTNGPYRLVRHPAYLGELVMTLSCAAAIVLEPASGSRIGAVAALLIVTLAGLVWRIRREERILDSDAGWSAYARATRHRLIPFIW